MFILRNSLVAFLLTAALPAGAWEYKLPPEALGPPTSPPSQPAEPPPPVDLWSDLPDNYACPGVMNYKTWIVNPRWKDRDLTKAQCRREVYEYREFVRATLRKTKTANFSAGGASCVLYCYDLYPDIKIPIP